MPTSYPAQTLMLEGTDALSFAQAQFSSNVCALETGQWQFSAWLDGRGRVRFFFHLARVSEQQLALLLRGGEAAAMADALQRYVFRAQVQIRAHMPRVVGSGPAMPLHAVRTLGDPEAFFLGCGEYSLTVGPTVKPDDAWRLAQLRTLWPWLPDNALEQCLAPALGLDRLGATALDKGCYPGQEIVARLHYRGGHKRHLHHVQLSRAVPAGSLLSQDGHELMRLLDVVSTVSGAEALAIIPDDLAHDGADAGASAEFDFDLPAIRVTVRRTRVSPAPNVQSAE